MAESQLDPDHFNSDGTGCNSHQDCPLSATHSRLREAHRQFHDAEQHYSDPDAFTSYLNGCIQSLRNVTFVLQKCKGIILGFDDWYTPWQERLRNDKILRWIVDARNQIVKKGDLETCSVANIAIVHDYSAPPAMQLPFPPCESVESLSQFLIDEFPLRERDRRDAILRVERRWVAEGISKVELLQALAHAYTTLSYLIRDAHRPLEKPIERTDLPEHLPGQPLPCMESLADSKVFYTRFQDAHVLSIERHEIDVSKLLLHKAKERYGEIPAAPEGAFKGPENLVATCEHLFAMARMMMEKDGYHNPFVFYLTDNGMQLGGFEAEDRSEKLLLWRNVAREVERLRAYAVIHIAEIWFAQFDPEHPERSATDSPSREEALALLAISSRGEQISWRAKIYRSSDGVILGETQDKSQATPYFFEPVIRVWQTMFDRASIAPTKSTESDADPNAS